MGHTAVRGGVSASVMATNKRINRAAMAQLDEALHAVADCDRAVWTLKRSIGECRSALGAGSFASTAAEARAIARALAMCARSIDAAVASAVAESVAAAEKAPGGSVARGSGAKGGRTNSREGGSGASVATTPAARVRPTSAPLDMGSPAAARLVAAARETVTIHLVRPARKPRAAIPADPDENGRVNNDDEEDDEDLPSAAGRPPVGPARAKPVSFQFQRRVYSESGGVGGVDAAAAGAGAFDELLPSIQEKLGLATHVVEVVSAADGVARRSDADFVDGEVCVVYSAADGRRRRGRGDETVDETVDNSIGGAAKAMADDRAKPARVREIRRDSLARLAAPSARSSRVVVNLVPTSLRRRALEGRLGADDDDEGTHATRPWTEVTLPASCSTRVEALRRCEEALYRAERIVTPLLGLYAGDGTHLEGVEGLKNGDVLLYRTAKEPVPDCGGAPAGDNKGESRAMRRVRAASLAAPKAEWSQSFEVSVARVGDGSAEGIAESSVGAKNRMRLPTRGLENMSLSQLSRRIRMACALSPDTAVEAVYAMPAGERVEHPAQLAGVAAIAYALEGDEPPKKPEPGAFGARRKKKVSSGRRVSAAGVGGRGGGGGDGGDGGEGTVFRPASLPRRPTTAPPSAMRGGDGAPTGNSRAGGTKAHGFGFGSTVRFSGDEHLPSAMAKAAKESSKKAAQTQATQLQLGSSFDGLVTSAITPRSSAEKLLVNNPMGTGRKTRPTTTTTGPAEYEPPPSTALAADASPPVRERWVDVGAMDASTMSAKNAAAAAAWAEYHEKNAWPSPELRRIAELGYVPTPDSPASAEPTSRHLQG